MTGHTFLLDGISVVVQPHNTFIYILIENGILGLVLCLLALGRITVSFLNCKSYNYANKVMIVAVFGFVNCFDSILYIQPGVATLFWMMLFLVYEENCADSFKIVESEDDRIRC